MTRLLSRRSIDSVLRDLPVNSLNTIEERRRLCKFIGYTSVPDVRVQVWDVTPSEGESFAVERIRLFTEHAPCVKRKPVKI